MRYGVPTQVVIPSEAEGRVEESMGNAEAHFSPQPPHRSLDSLCSLGMTRVAPTHPSEESEAVASRMRKLLAGLTPRQRDVVEQVAAGNDNQQIADELKISVLTVKKHLQAVFQSLDVHHRTELAAKWHQAHSVQLY